MGGGVGEGGGGRCVFGRLVERSQVLRPGNKYVNIHLLRLPWQPRCCCACPQDRTRGRQSRISLTYIRMITLCYEVSKWDMRRFLRKLIMLNEGKWTPQNIPLILALSCRSRPDSYLYMSPAAVACRGIPVIQPTIFPRHLILSTCTIQGASWRVWIKLENMYNQQSPSPSFKVLFIPYSRFASSEGDLNRASR